jgi:hypothetical protein
MGTARKFMDHFGALASGLDDSGKDRLLAN